MRCLLSRVIVTLLICAAAAHAQPTDDELGDVATFLALFPEVRQMRAPAFIQPGLRVSYQSASAIIGGGGAGGGVLQYDVLANVGSQVIARLQSYADAGQGPYSVSTSAARGLPGLGPFWINPAALVGAEQFNGGSLTVSRYDKDLADGRTAEVVRFQTQTANGRTVFEFDAGLGLLVFNSLTAGQQESQLVYLGAREIATPWPAGRAPNWVRPQANLRYQGSYVTTVSGAGAGRQAVDLGVAIVDAGARWSVSLASLSLDGANQGQSAGASGHRGVGGLWLPESALAQGPPAQPRRFDTDPFTGAELWFSSSPDGTIDIEERTAASVTRSAYHPVLGVLQRSAQRLNMGTAIVETELARVTPDADLEALARARPIAEDPLPGGAGGQGGDGGQGGEGGDGGEGGQGGEGGASDADAEVGGEGGQGGDPVPDGGVVRVPMDGGGGGGGCSSAPASGDAPWAVWLCGFGLWATRRR